MRVGDVFAGIWREPPPWGHPAAAEAGWVFVEGLPSPILYQLGYVCRDSYTLTIPLCVFPRKGGALRLVSTIVPLRVTFWLTRRLCQGTACATISSGPCEVKRVGLDLELCGVVREVKAGDVVPRGTPPAVTRLRDSHHAAARLIARGLNETEVSHLTGYALSRISSLKRDPLFAELVEAYRLEQREAQRDLEALWLGVATDYGQHIHEALLDNPEAVPVSVALDVFKAFADRAGMAPVSRSVNKNLNLNIGERLDRARGTRPTVIDQEPSGRKAVSTDPDA